MRGECAAAYVSMLATELKLLAMINVLDCFAVARNDGFSLPIQISEQ